MMRHVNRPIYSDTSAVTNPARPETAYYGSFNIRTAGTIEANFPWVEKTRSTPVPERLILMAG